MQHPHPEHAGLPGGATQLGGKGSLRELQGSPSREKTAAEGGHSEVEDDSGALTTAGPLC